MISIRRQLTHELLLAVIVMVVIALSGVYWSARESAIDQFDDALQSKALAITTLTLRSGDGVQLSFSDRFLRGFDDDRRRDFFELRDRDGRVLERSDSLRSRQTLMAEIGRIELKIPFTPKALTLRKGHAPRAGKINDPEFWNMRLPNGDRGRAIAFRFVPRSVGSNVPNKDDEVHLVVASDREKLDELLGELLGISAGASLVLALGTFLVIPRVLRRGLKPLDELGRRVSRIDAGTLSHRVSDDSLPAELKPVASRIDDLIGRLEQSFERERRFSADLAHELRTPIAELRTLAECALRWPEQRDPMTDRDVLATAAHMETLVTNILALARGEQLRMAARKEPIAVEPLVATAWHSFAPRAAARGLKVHTALAPVTALADAALLRSVLNNLLDNAVDHASDRGSVEISLSGEAGHAVIRIANTTSEIEEADLPRLFERFWRKEASRSGGEHLGLGLCLAHAFAVAMGWTLTVRLEPGFPRRIEFTLGGPLAPATT